MRVYRIDLNCALADWLAARERFLSRSGRDSLDRYEEANYRLFAAFVEGWTDAESAAITQAFGIFRKYIMQQADAGRPKRFRFHPCPVAPALA